MPLKSTAANAAPPPRPLRCHCRACRRFHASSFAALLPLDHIPAAFSTVADDTVQRFESECAGGLSTLSRVSCRRCKSILGAVPLGTPSTLAVAASYLAMGCIEDASIPPALALAWQGNYQDLATDDGARWWTATPSSGRPMGGRGARVLRGRCACERCAFAAPSGDEFQTQHCYCNLCRRLSGSVAQTWVPVRPNGFEWTSRETLALVRTTSHGQRHMCTACGTTLTIVYDSQPDCIWPVAGVLDDDSLPSDLPSALARTIHICCTYMQTWYELPDDSMPRLRNAG